jgi:bifunctional non-homologous end joining protein LigD
MKEGAASNFYFIEPMMALRAGDLPIGNWIYELKFDGYRALAFKADKDVRLVSRNRTNFNKDYPQLVDSLRLLTANKVTIDGEITALDENGKSSFQLLQSYGTGKQIPLVYQAFDLLFLDGTDLRPRPLIERLNAAKTKPSTRRCRDRSSDSSTTFRPVYSVRLTTRLRLLISNRPIAEAH